MAESSMNFNMYDQNNLNDDDIRIQFTLVLREILNHKIIPKEELAQICDTTIGTLGQWKLDNPKKWAGVERAKKFLPILLEIFNNHKQSLTLVEKQIEEKLEIEKPIENVVYETKSSSTALSLAFNKVTENKPLNVKPHTIPLDLNLISKEEKTIETLKQLYTECIGKYDQNIENRLNEYFMYLQTARERDWFDWAFTGIIISSKPTLRNHSIGYLIGVYKNWLKRGFGVFQSDELDELINTFKEKFNIEPSQNAIRKINELKNEYGTVNATKAILGIPPLEEDISFKLVNNCFRFCENKHYIKAIDKFKN